MFGKKVTYLESKFYKLQNGAHFKLLKMSWKFFIAGTLINMVLIIFTYELIMNRLKKQTETSD